MWQWCYDGEMPNQYCSTEDAELRKSVTHMMNVSAFIRYDMGRSGSLLCAWSGITYFIIRISSFSLLSQHRYWAQEYIAEFHMPLIMWGEEKVSCLCNFFFLLFKAVMQGKKSIPEQLSWIGYRKFWMVFRIYHSLRENIKYM